VRLVKSDTEEIRKAMAEPDTPPTIPQIDQAEVSGDAHLGIVELFESLRGRLIIFFEKRNCIDPEELADATLERVVKKLCEGAKVSDLGRYSFGVAKKIFLEYLRKKNATVTFFDEQKYRSHSTSGAVEDDAVMRERQLTCLEECLGHLKEHDRTMLLEYYQFNGRAKLDQRRKMAKQMNISRETLALRIFHLKQKLKKCVSERLEDI